MELEHEKTRLRDSWMLKHERSLRRSRIGAIILAVLFIIAAPNAYRSTNDPIEASARQGLHIGMAIFCGMLGYQYHLKIRHIESIKMYRQKNDKLIDQLKQDGRQKSFPT